MDKRSLTGWIIFGLGIIVSPILLWTSIPVSLIGLIIALNRNEDKIEKINYKEVKNEK